MEQDMRTRSDIRSVDAALNISHHLLFKRCKQVSSSILSIDISSCMLRKSYPVPISRSIRVHDNDSLILLESRFSMSSHFQRCRIAICSATCQEVPLRPSMFIPLKYEFVVHDASSPLRTYP